MKQNIHMGTNASGKTASSARTDSWGVRSATERARESIDLADVRCIPVHRLVERSRGMTGVFGVMDRSACMGAWRVGRSACGVEVTVRTKNSLRARADGTVQ